MNIANGLTCYIASYIVLDALTSLNKSKACGPDHITAIKTPEGRCREL